jgi:hypothetical protein
MRVLFGKCLARADEAIQGRQAGLGRQLIVALAVCLVTSTSVVAQWMGKQTGCYADSMVANPNRPTVANPADITQYGVLELEYGWDRVWPQEDVRQTSVGGLLKFGLLCDIELRWTSTAFLSQTDATGTHQGFGDSWVGTQIRLYKQTKRVPALAFAYATKIPSASTEDGLGTGRVDHSFTFLASKDIAHFHFDFNLTRFLIGRGNGLGFDQPAFDQNDELNLAFSRPIRGQLQFTGEFYGDTQLNRDTPSFVSSLWALTYTITPRLVIDGGFESALTPHGPHRHPFAGVTYSIVNFYPGSRQKRPSSPASKHPSP